MPEFKLLLVGADGVSRATFVANLEGHKFVREFNREVVDPISVETIAHSVVFHTNRGPIKFNVIHGHHLSGSPVVHNIQYQCSIIMTLDASFDFLHSLLTKEYGDIPYYDVSARSSFLDFDYEKPFLSLARKLLGDDQLQFISPPTPSLQELCVRKLLASMTVENAAELFQVADARPDPAFASLREKAFVFIRENYTAFSMTGALEELGMSNMELFLEKHRYLSPRGGEKFAVMLELTDDEKSRNSHSVLTGRHYRGGRRRRAGGRHYRGRLRRRAVGGHTGQEVNFHFEYVSDTDAKIPRNGKLCCVLLVLLLLGAIVGRFCTQ